MPGLTSGNGGVDVKKKKKGKKTPRNSARVSTGVRPLIEQKVSLRTIIDVSNIFFLYFFINIFFSFF